jgi:hypothetical protein
MAVTDAIHSTTNGPVRAEYRAESSDGTCAEVQHVIHHETYIMKQYSRKFEYSNATKFCSRRVNRIRQ